MGFYPPDSLVHEAQHRGVKVLGVDVNSSGIECTVEEGAVRLGLTRVKGVARECAAAIVASRSALGRYGDSADLASRSGAGRPALEALAWAGACDSLSGSRRAALWELGVGAVVESKAEGDQLALPIGVTAPELDPLDAWGRALADYSTTGIAIEGNPLRILRPRLPGTVTAAELPRLRHGSRVKVAGFVVARQRPQTAGGVVFLLLEDEMGTINVVIKPREYERHRLIARAEPLLLVEGVLERPEAAGGGMSVLASRLERVESAVGGPAAVRDLFACDPPAPELERFGAERIPRASSDRRGR